MKKNELPGRCGASATELAIIFPLAVFLCLAAVDFGRFARWSIALENAVRVGAEYGAARRVTAYSYDGWEEEVINRVEKEFDSSQQESLNVTAQVSTFDEELPRVNVSGEYTFTTVMPWWAIPESIVIRRTFSLQRYR